jgi:hypothetical protein
MELCVIFRERCDDMRDWRDWVPFTFRRPHRPSIAKFSVEIGSVLLITGGIVGELWAGVKINSINGALRTKSSELRNKSDQLLALINEHAKALEKEAEDERVKRTELERQIHGRTIDNPKQFSNELKKVAPLVKGRAVKLSSYMFDVEAGVLCLQLTDVFKDAGIASDISSVGRLMLAGIPTIGIKVLGPPTDKKFMEALAKGLQMHTGFPAKVELHPNNAEVITLVGSKPLPGKKEVWP